MTAPHLSAATIARTERRFDALREAEALLGLIDAEFRTDPMSVQCFDLRVVERVRQCVQTLKDNPEWPG